MYPLFKGFGNCTAKSASTLAGEVENRVNGKWCGWSDSNRQRGNPQRILSPPRMPISPQPHRLQTRQNQCNTRIRKVRRRESEGSPHYLPGFAREPRPRPVMVRTLPVSSFTRTCRSYNGEVLIQRGLRREDARNDVACEIVDNNENLRHKRDDSDTGRRCHGARGHGGVFRFMGDKIGPPCFSGGDAGANAGERWALHGNIEPTSAFYNERRSIFCHQRSNEAGNDCA